ncbi:MAG: hypothetical protein HY318_04880 [Armatimonadetes bacterium]|nr:hypothetical protein [Armatimonadota bacterium]
MAIVTIGYWSDAKTGGETTTTFPNAIDAASKRETDPNLPVIVVSNRKGRRRGNS